MKEHVMDMEEVKKAISETTQETAVYIGCDSARFTNRDRVKMVAYVTVVVLHFNSNAGGKVYKRVDIQRDYGSLKERLMNEVYYAANLAYELVDTIGDRPFEIHLDLNLDPRHRSNVAVKEAIGYVKGMLGFAPILKPDSMAATTIADRYT